MVLWCLEYKFFRTFNTQNGGMYIGIRNLAMGDIDLIYINA